MKMVIFHSNVMYNLNCFKIFYYILGNCDGLQTSMSMEVDPSTGYMWIIDSGSPSICPSKVIVWDVRNEQLVAKHIFPSNVANQDTKLNDIVLAKDENNGQVRYAIISDTARGPISGNQGGLIVYDIDEDLSWRFEHISMEPEEDAKTIEVLGVPFDNYASAVNGIVVTDDSANGGEETLFYSSLGGNIVNILLSV